MRARWVHYLFAALLTLAGWLAYHAWGASLLVALGERGVTVERPALALALLGVPWLIAVRAHSLSALPRAQRGLSLLLKVAFVVAITLSLVNPEILSRSPKGVEIVYLVDVSESVPDEALERARAAVEASWIAAGEGHEGASVRLVVFAGQARELPLPAWPGAGEERPAFPTLPRLSSGPATWATDIQGALRLAFTLFGREALPRIVLVTDGVETRGALREEAATARRFGIPVHYLDLTDAARPGELMVLGATVPERLEPRIPFKVRGAVRATKATSARCALSLDGRAVDEAEARLAVGENAVELEARVMEGGEHRVALECEALDEGADRFAANNRFELPIVVRREPRVLYIEGERRYRKNLASALDRDFDVELRGPSGVPSTLADAERFDLIFISDVPRIGARGYPNMTTQQMRVLERYARAGGGVVFAGGDSSLGPGGYGQTWLEREVLPLRLDVKRELDTPGVALMLVMDRSGSMTGPKLELAKQAAIATLGALQPSDKLGVIAFDQRPTLLVPLQRASNRYKITEQVSRLRSGGGTNIFAALDRAHAALARTQAKVKHIILLTDGQSSRSGVAELAAQSHLDKITISTVAVGMGSDKELLRRVADEGRGRYYFTNSPQSIPRLFLKETRAVSRRALVDEPFRPKVAARYRGLQIFAGLDMARAPSLLGYVATRPKPRAEVLMTSHLGEPILARWRLGLGRVVVWTSDVKNKWAHYWLSWSGYAKFWRQLLRATMRIEAEDPSFQMLAEVVRGRLEIAVDAVDDDDHFIDGLAGQARVVDPAGEERTLTLTQTAAGRYGAELELSELGPYSLYATLAPPDAPDQLHHGSATASWPFPDEQLMGAPDLREVRALAEVSGGVAEPSEARLFEVGAAHTTAREALWPYPLYLALALLVLDLALRRVRLYGETALRWRDVTRGG